MRRVEFGLEVEPDGKMNFRTTRIFGGTPMTWLGAAVDGQLGSIVRLYREWRFSNDDAFLAELWPNAVKALEYAFDTWDTDRDGVLDGRQHNTYDHDLYGANPLANAIFFAALRAAAEMADHAGDTDRAERYRNAAVQGADTMDRLLWNGEYYIQRLMTLTLRPTSLAAAVSQTSSLDNCSPTSRALGMSCRAITSNGRLHPSTAHNFRLRQMRNHVNYSRTYALEDEGGLVLCSWPQGGRPRRPSCTPTRCFQASNTRSPHI